MINRERIAFVIHGLVMGGAEKFLIALINDFDKKEIPTSLVLLSDDNRLLPELNSRTEVVIIQRKTQFDFLVSYRIKRFIQERSIKKVFCINTYSFFLTKLAYLFDFNTRFYLSLHSTIPPSLKAYLQNLVYFRFVGRSDTLIFLCDPQRHYLEKKYLLRHSSAITIHNGIDTCFFDPSLFTNFNSIGLKKSMNIPDGVPVVLQVARLHPEKGYTDSISALLLLHTVHHINAHLVIVGAGSLSYQNRLREFVYYHSLSDYVHFVGEKTDVRPFLCIADLFTLTSFGTETFSLAALEAMAFGVPCSLTNIGGASDMIVDGVNGALSSPKNPISIAQTWRTILNADLNKSIIREIVLKRFNSSRMFDEYVRSIA